MPSPYKAYAEVGRWDDLRVEPVARTTGNNAPTFEKWADDNGLGGTGSSRGVYLYSFDNAAGGSEKEVHFTMQLPHSYLEGSTLHLHVHWIGAASENAVTPRWGLEYQWKNIGSIFAANKPIIYTDGINYGSSDTGTTTHANVTAGRHYMSFFTPMVTNPDRLHPDEAYDRISSVLIGRLFRDSANAADSYTNKVGLLYIDAHILLDSIGSREVGTK
jgi:hypothetical protein